MNSQSHLRKTNSYESERLQRNSLIFGILMILLQIGLSLVYGFLINIEAVQLNVSSIIIIIGLAILIIGGNSLNMFRFWTSLRIHQEIGLEWHRLYLLHYCTLY